MSSGQGDNEVCIQIPPCPPQPQCQSPARTCGCLSPFCQCVAFKEKQAADHAAKCRQPGEYDPCQNPCARIPGQHPFCPPGQIIGILPKGYVHDIPRSLNKPTSGPPPRLPWKQCVENPLINDQVRRPMAKWCHFRELPPVVVPNREIERMRDSIDERERKKEECRAAAEAREAARQASYQRHSEWNYTVDSLLERKRKEEKEKAEAEEREFKDLDKRMKEAREQRSFEAQARAKQQLLYRKGLIRDFHAAMAYSKVLKDTEDMKKAKGQREVCQFKAEPCADESAKLPIETENCYKRLQMENERPDYAKKQKEKKTCRPELLELLKCDEARVPEREAELKAEKEKVAKLRMECPLPWPEVYIKHTEEPKCQEAGVNKYKKQEELRQQIFQEIHDKLANDAFMEYHEKEIERQACEYAKYKQRVDRLRKEKEAQLIRERVARNQERSEIAAKKILEIQSAQAHKADEYSRLKDMWEAEYAQKEEETLKWKKGREERISQDFLCRRDNALCKRAHMEATREWEKECCAALDNHERTCVRENTRREKAKELQQYHLHQIAQKTAKQEDERFLNAAYGEKQRMNYACEMNEMKRYANEQIQDWQAKGRPIFPMVHAMKKWDYEAGMNPKLYARTPCGPQCTSMECEQRKLQLTGTGACDEDTTHSTAHRLGFCAGPTGGPQAEAPGTKGKQQQNGACVGNKPSGDGDASSKPSQ